MNNNDKKYIYVRYKSWLNIFNLNLFNLYVITVFIKMFVKFFQFTSVSDPGLVVMMSCDCSPPIKCLVCLPGFWMAITVSTNAGKGSLSHSTIPTLLTSSDSVTSVTPTVWLATGVCQQSVARVATTCH